MSGNDETVAFEWKPGDVILDLYEVRPVSEGFGENARQKAYHEGGFGRVYKVWHRTWLRDMAVKCPREHSFTTQGQKDAFARECEVWINLGLHPHVAACHYVRNLGGVPRLFSEYAEAGTLEEWIRSRRLYEGDESTALARILDVAIQFAWGLHYAHERGIIHQDVKPLNALMWDDATLKVSDFGIAGAREKAGLYGVPGGAENGLLTTMVSSGGMTVAYCSPEQLEGKKLDRRTDIWSWAVSVLQMFFGDVVWQSGRAAAEALEAFLEQNGEGEGIRTMPMELADLLRQCFQQEPTNRPRTLADCAATVLHVYQTALGVPYPRPEPQTVGDTPDYLNNRALSFLDVGKPDSANDLFDRTLEMDKHHLAATYNRNLMLWRAGKSTDSCILALLEEIRKEHPNDGHVECALGWVRMENADFARALAHFEKASELGAGNEARTALGQAHLLAQVGAGFRHAFAGHTGIISSVAYSPDSRYVLSGSWDRTLRFWDIATGQCLRILEGHTDRVNSVAYSPKGQLVLSASNDQTLRLWDVATGQCLRVFKGHLSYVNAVAFSPCGSFAVSGGGDTTSFISTDNTIRLWELATGRCLRTFEGHTHRANSLVYSPDGRFILSGGSHFIRGGEENMLWLWEVASGRCLYVFKADRVNCVAYSRDGRFVLSGRSDLCLWDVATGQCLRTFEGHTDEINSVTFSPDDCFALSGGGDDTVRLWDVATGRCLRTFGGHTGYVSSVAFSPDGRFAISGGWDRITVLWDISSVMERRHVLPWLYSMVITVGEATKRQFMHQALLSSARQALSGEQFAEALTLLKEARAIQGFERNSESLVLQARAGTRCRVKSYNGGWLVRTFVGHDVGVLGVCSVAFSPDGKFALSGGGDRTPRLWDVTTGKCLRAFDVHWEYVASVAYSPDGRLALSGSSDYETDDRFRLWDIATGKCLQILKGHTATVSTVAFSPDGRFFLSGSWDKTVRLWNTSTCQCLRTFEGDLNVLRSVAFSRNGRFFVSGSGDASSATNTVRLWNFDTGKCLCTFEGHSSGVLSVAYSPDGHCLVTGGIDKTIRLWNVATGQCLRVFEGETKSVGSVAYSPDGRFILSGGSDVMLWEVATGKCLRIFSGHTSPVHSVAFSPDGRFALSGSGDYTLKLWEIDWEYEYDLKSDVLRNG